MKIAVFVSPTPSAQERAAVITGYLKTKGVSLLYAEGGEGGDAEIPAAETQRIRESCRFVLSLGGDGTFLRASGTVMGTDIPLAGINLGRLGFLNEGSLENYRFFIDGLLAGQYELKERTALECRVKKGENYIFEEKALNDAAIHRGAGTRLLNLSFHINGNYGGTYRADGLVLSTPTGSTAYSLAAGGPIVHPDVDCILLTALCPHTLSARPLVLSPRDEIAVTGEGNPPMSLSLDGHLNHILAGGESVLIRKARKGVKIVHMNSDFYKIVREKLQWVPDNGDRSG